MQHEDQSNRWPTEASEQDTSRNEDLCLDNVHRFGSEQRQLRVRGLAFCRCIRTLNRLNWRPMSLADRDAIMAYVAQDNPTATIGLDLEFEARAENARQWPKLYKPGRMKARARSSCD